MKQAILDRIVKRPMRGVAKINEKRSTHASIRYEGYLVAGVERWKEYRKQLAPLGKKPVLFIMLNGTDEADDVGDWLKQRYGNASRTGATRFPSLYFPSQVSSVIAAQRTPTAFARRSAS